jgi:hypothetical protein
MVCWQSKTPEFFMREGSRTRLESCKMDDFDDSDVDILSVVRNCIVAVLLGAQFLLWFKRFSRYFITDPIDRE